MAHAEWRRSQVPDSKTGKLSGQRPLSDEELDQLGAFLAGCGAGRAMNVEELDGFFCALVMGPDLIMPSEYLPIVLGGGGDAGPSFASLEDANSIMQLVMRHWNTIAAAVERGDLYLPVMLEAESGSLEGQRWASGFMRGVALRRSSWAGLVHDENESGSLFAIALLGGDVDPEFVKKPLPAECQEDLVKHAVAGMNRIARNFAVARRAGAGARATEATVRRESRKIGRNEPCPCGSRRKYKQCCGRDGEPVRH
jgi:uncharacterized protein